MTKHIFKEFNLGELMEEFSLAEIREVAVHDYRLRPDLVRGKYLDRINAFTKERLGQDENHPAYWGYLFEYAYSELMQTGLTDAEITSAIRQ